MKNPREFNIAFVGLKPGKHQFFYTLDSEDLALFSEKYNVYLPEANINLELNKKETFLQLNFALTLKGDGVCDRCMDRVPLDFWDEFVLLVKFSSNPDEDNLTNNDDDIVFIARGDSHINVYDWIMEMLTLMLPMQLVHDEGQCNPQTINILENLTPKEPKRDIWKDLDNLDFN